MSGNGKDLITALRAFGDELRKGAQPGDPFHPDTPWSQSEKGDGWEGMVRGFCPTQGEGTVDGLPWYYRSRWGGFQFGIAEPPGGDAVATACWDAPGFSREGDADEWEAVADAWAMIRRLIDEYRTEKSKP
jgi:hypothetical protein